MGLKNKCYFCNESKDVVEFVKNKGKKLGVENLCLDCSKIKSKLYYRTKDGLVTQMYKHQKSSSKTRSHQSPSYTKQEFKEWLFAQQLFHELFQNWVDNDYDKNFTPSVDRINDYIGYTFNNIQLGTWLDNFNKLCKDRINGNNRKQLKAVMQYDMKGNLIKEYYSINQAGREANILPSDIRNVCQKIARKTGGFIWKYSDDKSPIDISFHSIKHNRCEVAQCDLDGNVIKVFKTIQGASCYIGVNPRKMSRVSINGNIALKGYLWKQIWN